MEIIRPFAGFYASPHGAWENPERAYDNDLVTYAVATISTYFFRLPPLTEQQIQKLKIMVIPHGVVGQLLCGIGYGTSRDDNEGVKAVRYTPDGESYAVIELTEEQLNRLYQHSDTVDIFMRADTGTAEIAEVYAVIDSSAIYVGNKQTSDVYVGATKASAVYIGTKRVV